MIGRVARYVLVLSAGLCAAPLPAQTPLDGLDFVSVRGISALSFSPDGLFVTWQTTQYAAPDGPDSRVWLAEVAPRQVRMLGEEGVSAHQPKWRPDGAALGYLADADSRGDDDVAQIYTVSVKGRKARALTHSATPITAYDWSPDARRVAYVAKVLRSESNYSVSEDWRVMDRDEELPGLWELEIESGKVRPLTEGRWRVRECAWSRDGRGIYFLGTNSPAADRYSEGLFYVDADAPAQTVQQLLAIEGYATDLRISADGASVSYLGARHGGDAHDLFVYSVRDKTFRNVSAASIDQAILGETFEGDGYSWLNDGTLLVTYARGFVSATARLTLDGVRTDVGVPPGNLTSLAVAPKQTWTAAAVSTTTSLPEVYLRRGATGSWQALTSINASFKDKKVRPLEVFKYPSFDGRTIEGGLLLPEQAAGSPPPPLVVWVHGGPAFRSKDEFHGWGQYFARHGYAVLYVNFRGSIGYGYEFMALNRNDWGGGDFKDIMHGVQALEQAGKIDSDHVAIAGWSYGGYMAGWAITQTDRFKAAVAGAGMYDLASEFGTEMTPAYDEWYLGTPYHNLEVYMRSSPMTHIKNAKTPTLILHGELDPVDPLGQAQQFYRGLKWLGVQTELVVYAKGDHAVLKQKQMLDKYRRSVEWLDRFVKGRTPH